MSSAIERLQAATKDSPSDESMFTQAFLGALAVGFEDYGRLDKGAWDRCIRIATDTTNRMHAERRAAA